MGGAETVRCGGQNGVRPEEGEGENRFGLETLPGGRGTAGLDEECPGGRQGEGPDAGLCPCRPPCYS